MKIVNKTKAAFDRRVIRLSILMIAASAPIFAAGGGPGLPWESALTKIGNSISGPTAYVLALIGIVLGGGMLLWNHHDMGNFGKVAFGLTAAAGIVLGAVGMLGTLYPAAGALI